MSDGALLLRAQRKLDVITSLLKKLEWSRSFGYKKDPVVWMWQCPICRGMKEDYGFADPPTGHTPDCELKKAIG